MCAARARSTPLIEVGPAPRDGAWAQAHGRGEGAVRDQAVDGRAAQTGHLEHHGKARKEPRWIAIETRGRGREACHECAPSGCALKTVSADSSSLAADLDKSSRVRQWAGVADRSPRRQSCRARLNGCQVLDAHRPLDRGGCAATRYPERANRLREFRAAMLTLKTDLRGAQPGTGIAAGTTIECSGVQDLRAGIHEGADADDGLDPALRPRA